MPGLPMANSVPKPVRLVGAPETGMPCGERTWPYRGEGCLSHAKENGAPAQSNAPQASGAEGNPSAELTPLTASGGKVIPGKASASGAPGASAAAANTSARHASTDGTASADDEQPMPESRQQKRHHRHHGFFFGFRF